MVLSSVELNFVQAGRDGPGLIASPADARRGREGISLMIPGAYAADRRVARRETLLVPSLPFEAAEAGRLLAGPDQTELLFDVLDTR